MAEEYSQLAIHLAQAVLKELYIKNMAVIDELRLEFDTGFQVLTGETGAGKSILVEAIGLILGQKAEKSLIRDGCEEAIVEASFDVSEDLEVRQKLESDSLQNPDDDHELLVRRHITSGGKNKIIVNGQRATLAQLQKLSAHLIDFTGQHEQISLLETANDISILDTFLKEQSALKAYQDQYYRTKTLHNDIQALIKLQSQKEQRLEWIAFQLKEFALLKIHSESEENELKLKRSRLKNQKVIFEFSHYCGKVLNEADANCLDMFKSIRDKIDRSDVLNELFGHFKPRLTELIVSSEDLAYEISRVSEKLSGDGGLDADEIEQRLHQLEKLKRKYGSEITEVLNKKIQLEDEKNSLESSDNRLQELQKKLSRELLSLKELALALSKARSIEKLDLEKKIQKELKFLLMPDVKFIVDVKSHAEDCLNDMIAYTETGIDLVQFLLSPNPGLAPRPLAKIASGGETSRIFLALKQVLAQSRKSGTLIFDEIDTGISGAAVDLVGQKLKKLSQNFQVFCVTHHAQIASQADKHYFVHKTVEKKKTITRVRTLAQQERVQEVARLMGGVEISEKNLAYAQELLKNH